tara:strand:+ start:1149 stop:1682 length:534 start_codon:yes stop_codon:yes gene_type:complete
MNRLILLLIVIVIHIDVSYASFPIHTNSAIDTLQTEEIKNHHYTLQKMGFDLSSCKCVSCRKGIEAIVVKPKSLPIRLEKNVDREKREPGGGLYVFLSVLSVIASLLFGLLSLGNGFSHNGSASAVLSFFLLSVISFIGSIILAVKARKQGVRLGGTILNLSLALLVVFFLFPLFFP